MDFRPTTPTPAQHAAPAVAKHKKRMFGFSGRVSSNVPLMLTALVLILIAAGTAAYFINKYNDSQKEVKRLSNPTEVARQEQQELVRKVGALTVLPKDETPTVATVADISKLKGQVFFANAQNGDKVLIYTKAKKAYLYRPSTNKIINIAPVNIGKGTSSTATPPPATTTPPAATPTPPAVTPPNPTPR